MELIDVELHEQSNQIRIVLYERKQHGCNKSHYTKITDALNFSTLFLLNPIQHLNSEPFGLHRRDNG